MVTVLGHHRRSMPQSEEKANISTDATPHAASRPHEWDAAVDASTSMQNVLEKIAGWRRSGACQRGFSLCREDKRWELNIESPPFLLADGRWGTEEKGVRPG